MRKLVAFAAVLVAALALTVPGAIGGPGQTPGVTAKSITIGGTFPLTGPAAAYAPIPLGMKAYFSYINARRGAGRQARRHGPSDRLQVLRRRRTTPPTRLSSRVASSSRTRCSRPSASSAPSRSSRLAGLHEPAEGSAGTRLDRRLRVRTRSTRSSRGRPAGSPTTSPRVACTASTSRRTIGGKKIAIVYQNDDYGKDYLYGFRAALGKKYADANVVAQEAVEATATSVAAQMMRIKASRCADPRRLPAADADRPDHRDGQGARPQPRADLHELRRRDQAGHGRAGRRRWGRRT